MTEFTLRFKFDDDELVMVPFSFAKLYDFIGELFDVRKQSSEVDDFLSATGVEFKDQLIAVFVNEIEFKRGDIAELLKTSVFLNNTRKVKKVTVIPRDLIHD